MNQDEWNEYRRKTKHWAIRIEYGLLTGEAFKSLNYSPAVKLLFWTFEKRKVSKTGAKKGRRKYVVLNGTFSFTYEEAVFRGLSKMQFWRAIRELVKAGFIDLSYQGTGLHGDYSRYELSDRWKRYGQKDFEHKQIAKRGWGYFQ